MTVPRPFALNTNQQKMDYLTTNNSLNAIFKQGHIEVVNQL